MAECTCTVCRCTDWWNECTCATTWCSCKECACEWCGSK